MSLKYPKIVRDVAFCDGRKDNRGYWKAFFDTLKEGDSFTSHLIGVDVAARSHGIRLKKARLHNGFYHYWYFGKLSE